MFSRSRTRLPVSGPGGVDESAVDERARCLGVTLGGPPVAGDLPSSVSDTNFGTAVNANTTTHRPSTSMHSLKFCVRVMSPERHHWKPVVQAAAVMLRTSPVDGQSPASSARRPRTAFALCRNLCDYCSLLFYTLYALFVGLHRVSSAEALKE